MNSRNVFLKIFRKFQKKNTKKCLLSNISRKMNLKNHSDWKSSMALRINFFKLWRQAVPNFLNFFRKFSPAHLHVVRVRVLSAWHRPLPTWQRSGVRYGGGAALAVSDHRHLAQFAENWVLKIVKIIFYVQRVPKFKFAIKIKILQWKFFSKNLNFPNFMQNLIQLFY